jgi:cyclopropane-fatty-acyl-phospholipid synthase
VKDEHTLRKIARNWEFQLGETYMNGDWDVADCELQDLLLILRSNFSTYRVPWLLRPLGLLLQQWNRLGTSLSNVSSHYDLDHHMFKLFLDRDMHYSCAYYPHPSLELEEAQQAKCRHISNKLLLRPGQKILDVGCGWGSLAFHLARQEDVEVVGITLSREQLDFANWRKQKLGLNNVKFKLADYREHEGHYDRIVSIGMFEHVGSPYYGTYFKQLKRLLKDDGIALVHSIGRSAPPGLTNPWIRKYIFPGGAIPSLSQMTRAAEDVAFIQTDLEVLRLHYAYTLRAWFDRVQENRSEIRERMGERFCRMWEFYLAICEVSFSCADLVVFQQQLACSHGVVPTTRDYLYGNDDRVLMPASRMGVA